MISANPSSCLLFEWLRGLDLNQRPLGYEPFPNQLELRGLLTSIALHLTLHKARW